MGMPNSVRAADGGYRRAASTVQVLADPDERVSGARQRARRRSAVGRGASGVVVGIICLLFVFPLFWMTVSSLKTTADYLLTSFPITWRTFIPGHPTLSNYATLFSKFDFGRSIWNTVIASAGQIVGALLVSLLAGYAFARMRSRTWNIVFGLCILGAFIPVEAVIVPLYHIVHGLGLLSTYPVLFLPFVCNPFSIFLMRQSFRDIPEEIYNAAAIDGAGWWRSFRHLAVPNVKPAIATVVLIQFIWSWSNFFWPLVTMQDPHKQVAQVVMADLQTAANNQPLFGEMFAAATLVTLPVVFIAIFAQRYYAQGLLSSGIK